MIVFGIILLILAILLSILIAMLVEEKDYTACAAYFIGLFVGIFSVLGCALITKGSSNKTIKEQTEFKYPVNEYKLEYEILTKGEQVHSTYVITKRE